MTSPLETVLRGIRTILLGNGTSKLALILFELGLAKALDASSFGVYAVAIAVSQVMANVCLLGLNFGVIQHLAVYREKSEAAKEKSVILLSLLMIAGAAGVMALALLLGAETLARDFFNKPELGGALKIAAPLLFFDALCQCIAAAFRGLRQFKNNFLTWDLLKNLACLVVLPALLLTGTSVEKALLVCAGGSMAGFLFGAGILVKQGLLPRKDEVDRSVLRDLLDFSKLLFLWNLLQVLAVRLFILAAGVFLTTAETGALAVAARLALVFIFFQTAVNSTVQAEFARFHHLKDAQAQKDLYQAVTQGLLGVVMVPALFILINPLAVTGIFGGAYVGYAWLLWPLLLAHLLNVVTGPAGQVLVATERQRLLMRLTLFDISMQFLIVLPLMYFHGVAGAVWGEASRIILFVVLRLWFLWRDAGVHLFGRCYVPLAALSGACIASGLSLTLSGAPYIVAMTYALAFYAGGALWIFFMDPKLRGELGTLLSFSFSGSSRRDRA